MDTSMETEEMLFGLVGGLDPSTDPDAGELYKANIARQAKNLEDSENIDLGYENDIDPSEIPDEILNTVGRPYTWVKDSGYGDVFGGYAYYALEMYEKWTSTRPRGTLYERPFVPIDPEEVIDSAKLLGIEPNETFAYYIAKYAVDSPLPAEWDVFDDDEGSPYWVNNNTGEETRVHPLDEFFKDRVNRDRHLSLEHCYFGEEYAWVAMEDSDRRMYFFNFETMTPSYEFPLIWRKFHRQLHGEATKIQTVVRRAQAIKYVEDLRSTRRRLMNELFETSILKLQAFFRGSYVRMVEMPEVKQHWEKCHKSATIIECAIRGKWARRKFRKRMEEYERLKKVFKLDNVAENMDQVREKAVTLIQKRFRGMRTRNSVAVEKEDMRQLRILARAATRIQSRYRGLLARKKLALQKKNKRNKKKNAAEQKEDTVLSTKSAHKSKPPKEEKGVPIWLMSSAVRVVNNMLCLKCRMGVLKKCGRCNLVWRVLDIYYSAKELKAISENKKIWRSKPPPGSFNVARNLLNEMDDLILEDDDVVDLPNRLDLQAMLLNDIAFYFMKFHEIDLAYVALHRALELALESQVHEIIVMSYVNLGVISNRKSLHDEAQCYIRFGLFKLLEAQRLGVSPLWRSQSRSSVTEGLFSKPNIALTAVASVCLHNVACELVAMHRYEAALRTIHACIDAGESCLHKKDGWLAHFEKTRALAHRRLSTIARNQLSQVERLSFPGDTTPKIEDYSILSEGASKRAVLAEKRRKQRILEQMQREREEKMLRRKGIKKDVSTNNLNNVEEQTYDAITSWLLGKQEHHLSKEDLAKNLKIIEQKLKRKPTTANEAFYKRKSMIKEFQKRFQPPERPLSSSPEINALKDEMRRIATFEVEMEQRYSKLPSGRSTRSGRSDSDASVMLTTEEQDDTLHTPFKSLKLSALGAQTLLRPATTEPTIPKKRVEVYGSLIVNLIESTKIQTPRGGYSENTFVSVMYDEFKRHSRSCNHPSNPVWMEKYQFFVRDRFTELSELVFLVWQRTSPMESRFLGKAIVPLYDCSDEQLRDMWLNVERRDGDGQFVSYGELHVALRFEKLKSRFHSDSLLHGNKSNVQEMLAKTAPVPLSHDLQNMTLEGQVLAPETENTRQFTAIGPDEGDGPRRVHF